MKRPEITYDAMINSQNINQRMDLFKRVLCICSGGLLRSPTTALILSVEPFNFNTRSAGVDSHHALICVDDVLMEWADEIVVMNEKQKRQLEHRWPNHSVPVLVLDIPDMYQYRQQELVDQIRDKYPKALEAYLAARREKYPTSEPVPEKAVHTDVQEGQGPKITPALPPIGEPGADNF